MESPAQRVLAAPNITGAEDDEYDGDTTLVPSSPTTTNFSTPPRVEQRRLRRAASPSNFAQEEAECVKELVQSNHRLSVEVQELRAELQSVQAQLEYSESEHIYKVSTKTLETVVNDAESRENSLRKDIEDGELRENELSRILEDTRSREGLLIIRAQEQAQQINQMRDALDEARSREVFLNEQLREQTDRECALQTALSSQLEAANQDRDCLHIVVEEASSRELDLKAKLEQDAERLREVTCRADSLQRELENTRREANHHRAENKALGRFALSFQDESTLPEDQSGEAIAMRTNCDACVQLLHHLSQVKRVNRNMAEKLQDYRFTAEERVMQVKRCQAWAEGKPQEKEIEARELVRLLEKQLADLRASNFTLCGLVTEEVNACTEAKLRAESDVERLKNLCAFKDNQIASMEADIGRVDSLQLHNAELLDAFSQPEEERKIFEHQRQSFAEEIVALTTRANTFEIRAQSALDEEAAIRTDFCNVSNELARLKDDFEKVKAEKAQVDHDLEKIQFCEAAKDDEKKETETAHRTTVQGLQATIQSLQDERERFLKTIPEDRTARDEYLYQIKCWEIDNLRAEVQRLSDSVHQLQAANEQYAKYANAYEMLEAELNTIDGHRNAREAGRSGFDRALKGVLEDEYGGPVDHLYRRAGERMGTERGREGFERENF